MYKFEVHTHSNACSQCAKSSAAEMIDAAAENGYSGIIFTNHFFQGNTCIDRSLPWEQFVKAYADDYYSAKEYGKTKNIVILFGFEDFYNHGKELLVYGISPELLAEHPEYRDAEIGDKVDFIRKNGGITVAAHPFRRRDYIIDTGIEPDPELFDGIECYNHFNRPSENDEAADFAKKYNKICTAGGDIHNAKDFGTTGLAFFEPVNSIGDFIDALKNGRYKMMTGGGL